MSPQAIADVLYVLSQEPCECTIKSQGSVHEIFQCLKCEIEEIIDIHEGLE